MTSDVGAMIIETLDRMLADACTPDQVRRWNAGDAPDALWDELVALGVLHALVPEEAGGVGLTLSDLGELAMLFGKHLVPLPLADTIAARALVAPGGTTVDEVPIVIVPAAAITQGTTLPLPLARYARLALVDEGDSFALVAAAAEESVGTAARIHLDSGGHRTFSGTADLLATAAALRAAETAGSLAAVLAMVVGYAGERSQFGKPLGSFQAIQQQIAVLAEESAAATMAARIAFAGDRIDAGRAGVAKLRTDAAARRGLAIAHAVTGAIGISEEYDLQLHSRRLIDARMAAGSETYWAERIGRARLSAPEPLTLDHVRTALAGR
ncbi:acyl-CoA dehydrogenase [Sphingomonas jejuensis]|uniref:Acyl-CoA dehydrogenase n=1 Tax=Sphingomonas jejuensis TaxID=904715 RepID=A0ABX0XJ99_9SPHN|nr:acyl-CoA dehydrogenase family protein [Sphingomonas jejuensis]NJC32882.1 acyl-CoA dehydrogenase [Sphingomonas jejuensis]